MRPPEAKRQRLMEEEVVGATVQDTRIGCEDARLQHASDLAEDAEVTATMAHDEISADSGVSHANGNGSGSGIAGPVGNGVMENGLSPALLNGSAPAQDPTPPVGTSVGELSAALQPDCGAPTTTPPGSMSRGGPVAPAANGGDTVAAVAPDVPSEAASTTSLNGGLSAVEAGAGLAAGATSTPGTGLLLDGDHFGAPTGANGAAAALGPFEDTRTTTSVKAGSGSSLGSSPQLAGGASVQTGMTALDLSLGMVASPAAPATSGVTPLSLASGIRGAAANSPAIKAPTTPGIIVGVPSPPMRPTGGWFFHSRWAPLPRSFAYWISHYLSRRLPLDVRLYFPALELLKDTMHSQLIPVAIAPSSPLLSPFFRVCLLL